MLHLQQKLLPNDQPEQSLVVAHCPSAVTIKRHSSVVPVTTPQAVLGKASFKQTREE